VKRPTWATVVGVLAIIFGIFGVFGGAYDLLMPKMLEMQSEMLSTLSEGQTSDGTAAPEVKMELEVDGQKQQMDMTRMFEQMGDMHEHLQLPDWYKQWNTVFAFISMAIAGLYMLSGIFLLMTKRYAAKVFYIAIFLSIVWAVVQSVAYFRTGNTMLMAMMSGSAVSLVIDVVLGIVVLVGSKEAFRGSSAEI